MANKIKKTTNKRKKSKEKSYQIDVKVDLRMVLIIIVALFVGSFSTYLVTHNSEANRIEQERQSKSYQDLSNLLVEIMGHTNGGVSQDKWGTLIKDVSIASNKYKISNTVKDAERLLLEKILKVMRQTHDVWQINLGYGCFGNKVQEKCIKKYASELREAFGLYDITEAEYEDRTRKALVNNKQSIAEHKSEFISLYLSQVSWAISAFFEYHDINL